MFMVGLSIGKAVCLAIGEIILIGADVTVAFSGLSL